MIKYYIDPVNELVAAKMTGDIDYSELVAWHYELSNRPDYKKHFSAVTDFREAKVLTHPE